MLLCGLGAVQSNFCIVAAKLQWSVGAIGYRCGCNWVCCYVGWGQQAPILARQPPTTNYWVPSWGLLLWRAVGPEMGTETPKAQPQWPLPIRGIMMCGYGGEVREVSGNLGLTSLTSTLGGCGVATKECSCTRVMNPSGYRVVSQWLCCYWGLGLHNSVSAVTLSIWQWPMAHMGIGWCPHRSAAMRLGGLENSLGGVLKLRQPLQTGQ